MKLFRITTLILLLVISLSNVNSQETTDQETSEEIIQIQKINLNDMTREDLTSTIPDFGRRMVREFFEYQPYISIQQFRREIGKYVNDEQVAFYEQYIYVPIDINESDGASLMQIEGITEEFSDALLDARPYESNEAFLETLIELIPDVDLESASMLLFKVEVEE